MQPLLAATLLALAMPAHATHGEALPELSDYLASCDRAGRAVWRHTLCAPVVIVDPADGGIVTSQPAPGPLPAVRANTAFDWMGTPWVMVLRPLPSDPAERANLLFHESFHVHQRALGFAPNANVAGHLSSWQARASIRLEWAELAQALDSTGQERMQHVRRALGFRARRLQGQPQAAADERALMRHEGLASYTGVALSGDPRTGKIDLVDWIETLPLRETRNYVQRIMEGVVVYRDRLNGSFRTVPPAVGRS